MDSHTAVYLIDKPLTLRSPNGTAIETEAHSLTLEIEGGHAIGCRLEFSLTFDGFLRVLRAGLFGLDDEARRQSLASLRPNEDTAIEAALDRALLPGFAGDPPDAGSAARRLIDLARLDPDSPLIATESWQALHVSQPEAVPGGAVKAGFSTTAAGLKSGSLMETIEQYFREEGWQYERVEGRDAFDARYDDEGTPWDCLAVAREDERQVILYVFAPGAAPESRRLAVAEYLTRANYGLIIGNFEMDFSDGEVRYRASIDVDEAELTPALFDHLAEASILAMRAYAPGLAAVMAGAQTPAEAIEQAEGEEP